MGPLWYTEYDMPSIQILNNKNKTIRQLDISHNPLCLPPKILPKQINFPEKTAKPKRN